VLSLPRYGRRVLSRWQGGFAALVATLATGALVILDVTDNGLRRWWAFHALTTDTVAGLLVLLITVLVVDQVVRLRQINSRARAVAAQAAIMVNQGIRSSQAVSQALAGAGDRDAAGDEVRTAWRYTKNSQARPACKDHSRKKHRPGVFRLLGCRPSWGVTHV
jgi:uncharacterized membrane protein YcjF (UPF0283 family)